MNQPQWISAVLPKIVRSPTVLCLKSGDSMPLKLTPDARSGYLQADPVNPDLELVYGQMREELERLMTEPIKDIARIDHLVDQLERVQLAIKETHGIKGNNPNE
jgi:hypothetical protein